MTIWPTLGQRWLTGTRFNGTWRIWEVSDSTNGVRGLLVERVCERTPSYANPGRAADNLEQQEEHPMQVELERERHSPSYDTSSGVPVQRGRRLMVRAKKYRETPPLQEQHA